MSNNTQCIIIGGGINGCGIARDLSLRGIHCVLIEKKDIGSDTTAHSTRLIHGGLRYLEHLEFGLVFDALRERELLAKNAVHLVHQIPFLLPVYQQSSYGFFKLQIGMILYDLLSLGKSVPSHQKKSAKDIVKMCQLEGKKLLGGFVYYDGQAPLTERLALANAVDAKEKGANIFTHTQMLKIHKKDEVWQVEFMHNGKRECVKAPFLINATGPWVDQIGKQIQPDKKDCAKVRGTKGVHLITKKISSTAIYVRGTDDRMLFVVPLGEYSLIGTTDTDYHGDLDNVYAEKEDVQYLLQSVKEYFPNILLGKKEIYGTYAGVRPLIFSEGDTSSLSRKHKIYEFDQCISIVGGKLTTYRQISEEVCNIVTKRLGIKQECQTRITPLPGAEIIVTEEMRATMRKQWKFSPEEMDMLYGLYGCKIPEIIEGKKRDKIHPSQPYFEFQVQYAFEKELAKSLQDVMARLGLLPLKTHSPQFIRKLAQVSAKYAGWTKSKMEQEISAYTRELEKTLACLQ